MPLIDVAPRLGLMRRRPKKYLRRVGVKANQKNHLL